MKIIEKGLFPKSKIKGILPQSDIFFHTPSEFAKKALYYGIESGIFYCDHTYVVERETFDSYLILLIRKGKMFFQCRGQDFVASDNSLVFLDCHSPHSYRADGDVLFDFFHFSGNSSKDYFDLLFDKNGCVFITKHHFVIHECMSQIISMFNTGNINEHCISAHIHKILSELNSVSNETDDIQERIINHAISYIESHFQSDLNLTDLAEHVNLSPFYFSRVFKKYTNFTPFEYIINYRLNYAKKLLRNSNLPIKEIVIASGFNSDAHFGTTFKKHTNLTPKQFREYDF